MKRRVVLKMHFYFTVEVNFYWQLHVADVCFSTLLEIYMLLLKSSAFKIKV